MASRLDAGVFVEGEEEEDEDEVGCEGEDSVENSRLRSTAESRYGESRGGETPERTGAPDLLASAPVHLTATQIKLGLAVRQSKKSKAEVIAESCGYAIADMKRAGVSVQKSSSAVTETTNKMREVMQNMQTMLALKC
mmetsp:Transcript_4428/g.5969  ORF Transcript_4428/g.5969 Transcript_4428/m.5969 type:complete len:138 (+) Transcript_4428:103-516(+)|eukprot:CAMPEP_0196586040 /NCGR_PEP_ID=MMETSP1081-20130531/52926_1 /TAXON_ID=36882 /ORGANISM="Pyramimonas amylifera, Strain CCMP720" /LENGTH=137 /DNA_ID=CAMNT_0041907781 /DNA_START=41 /DNA_END=454 /DNA_ORIENTATION=-